MIITFTFGNQYWFLDHSIDVVRQERIVQGRFLVHMKIQSCMANASQ